MIVSAIVFALVLGAFVFLLLPRARTWQRVASVATFVVLVAVVYGGSLELMSRPKPMRLEWREPGRAKVLAASLREGDAIYLWLQTDAASAPRAYILPWSAKTAQQLQTAMQQAQDSGAAVRMAMQSDGGTDDREPKFYAEPQRPLPDKNYAADGTLIVERPADAGDRAGGR
jgi:hypothetical protein